MPTPSDRLESPPHERLTRAPARAGAEGLWLALGARADFVESVLGDLAEEYARRTSQGGVFQARAWYVWEAVRSTPHMLRNAVRYGGREQRLRVAALGAGVVALLFLAALVIALRNGPPTRLVAGEANTVVVNSQRPIQLPMRVLDARGRSLDSSGVSYAWLAGAPVSLSADGILTCHERGDVTVRASLHVISTDVRVHCRPVAGVRAPWMMELVIGDAPTDIPFEALNPYGEPERMLTGKFSLRDSSIASITDQRLVPRKAGVTSLSIQIGDDPRDASVHVFEPAHSIEDIAPGQHRSVAIRLAPGEARRWHLKRALELHYFAIRPDTDGGTPPNVAILGAQCTRGQDSHSFFCIPVDGTSVVVYNSARAGSAGVQHGRLLVWRAATP